MDDPEERAAGFLQGLRESDVSQVQIVFLDYNGIARARSVAVDNLPSVVARGVNFSSPTVEFNSRDLFPPSAAFDLAAPDFWAKPDLCTYRPVPGVPHTGRLLANLVDAEGKPWSGCPRTALRQVVERAQERGLRFNVGFEPEGYVFRRAEGETAFVGLPRFATLAGLDVEPEFMADLLHDLELGGVSVLQWSEEYGPGQIEINLPHDAALEAADALVTFKEIFRSVALRHSLHATFMPKPFGDQAGSGLHVHLSASPIDDGSINAFDDPGDSELALSSLGRRALAGLMEHAPGLTALGASTVNSFKRFLPGSWAPTHIAYAYASRAAFVRIPERETPRRLELRIGDPACNPNIFLTGILAAMLDGIDRRLDPGSPTPGDLGALTADEVRLRGISPVPPTLERALDHLASDQVLREALGPVILDEFVKIKRSEWDAFRLHVGEWDREWYLDRY